MTRDPIIIGGWSDPPPRRRTRWEWWVDQIMWDLVGFMRWLYQ